MSEELGVWLDEALDGSGSLVLVAGEAGVGKTRFVEESVEGRSFHFLHGAPSSAALAYEPVVAALRTHLRTTSDELRSCGPLRPHLAMLLPELGEAVGESDRATLFEAVRCGLAAVAADRPTAILLDDLQSSDATTIELLGTLAPALREMPLIVAAVYRSDDIPRAHPLRRLRNDLRRNGLLREISLGPLTEAGTAQVAEAVLGAAPGPALARTLHDRTAGVPFFVEELAHALEANDRLESGDDGLRLALDGEVPLPQTIRDAVLLRTADLSDPARASAEAAAVAGPQFDPDLLADLGCEAALDEVIASGLITQTHPGHAEFRHPLARDAIYEDIPWARRRSLHRELAAAIEARGGRSAEVAQHRLAARDTGLAIDALIEAIVELAYVHAYRDAAQVGRQVLGLWPEGERGPERIAVLERYAQVASLAGELAEAARAQREVVSARRTEEAGRALPDAERSLATIYELQGDRDRALAARRVAADAYAASGLPGEAAAERLVGAGYLQSAGKQEEAQELTRLADEEATRAERVDLRARALSLNGVARVKAGDTEAGMETIREGLSLALEHGLSLVAAEAYQRLGTAHEIAGDYASSRDALTTAIGFCETDGGEGMEYTCVSCLAYVLRELGDWDRSAELCEELRKDGATPAETLVADGVGGSILAFRGDTGAARPLLEQCLETAIRLDIVSMGVDSAAALAVLEAQEGDADSASTHWHWVVERWGRSEDHHYAVWGLRWAVSFFAARGDLGAARACTEALSQIAARTGHPDVLAALAHALGETSLAEGEAEVGAEQLERAATLHEGLDIPFERAHIQLRTGIALGAAGRAEAAVEHLAQAHSTAAGLGATPLAALAAAEVARLGESVEERLGRRAAADYESGGLSRRELEVVRLVAAGQTNREIAGELVLSTRTVDMHVRNILTKLRCRTRTEAAGRAGDLGLLN